MAKLSKGMLGLLGEIASLINGAIASGLKLVNNLVSSGFKMAFQFNESAMAFSRQAGLTAKQAQAYTEVLTTRAKELGEKYGIAAEEVTKLERNLAKATGRVLMLSNAQADMQVAINRTVGEETANEFSQIMMRTMGAQIQTVQGAVSKAYATAAKNGLDAAGMAAKVAQNLSMANRLTFRNGVDGLTKMVALSEKFGVNVQTIESAANSFMDLQDAIENSAKLTMLGGAAGGLGGNPLDMTYEANADPEAFAERLTKMAGGYAQFDAKTGMAKLNYMSRDMLKGMADAMHISLDEMVTMAKKQAEVTYKNNNFGRDLDRLSGGDEQKRNYLLNKTQIENGRMKMYSSKTGKYEDMSYFENPKGGKAEFEEMMRFSNLSDEEIVREQAEAVVSIKDRLDGYFTSIQAMFGEKIAPFIPKIQEFLGDIYRTVSPYFGQIADNVKELLTTLFTPEYLGYVKDGITSLVKGLTWLGKVLTSNWKWLIAGALLSPVLSVLTWGFNMLAMFRGGGGSGIGGPAAGARPSGGGWGGSRVGSFRDLYGRNRNIAGNGVGRSFWNALNGRTGLNGNAGIMTKLTKSVGLGAGASLIGMGINAAVDDEKIARGDKWHAGWKTVGTGLEYAGTGAMIGATIGSFVPVLGNVVGGAVGATIGGAIGIWKQIADNTKMTEEYSKQQLNNNGEGMPKSYDGGVGTPPSGAKPVVSGDFRNVSNGGKWLGENAVEGVHDGGVNTPTSGAKSVVSDDFRDVANGVKNLSITEHGETFVTPGQRRNINKWIEARPNDVKNLFITEHDGGVNTPTSGAKPVVSDDFRDVANGVKNLSITEHGETFVTPGQRRNINKWIEARPIGQNDFKLVNVSQSSQNVGNNNITVNDINVRFSGSIRLEGDNNYRNYDINDLVENKEFIRRLFSRPEVMNAIMNSLNTNTNIGVMHDSGWLYRGESNYLSGKLMNT